MLRFSKRLLLLLLLWLPLLAVADAGMPSVVPLAPDRAFHFTATFLSDQQIELHWQIQPGYFLYRSQLHILPQAGNTVVLQAMNLPQGFTRRDVVHGVHQAYRGELRVPLNFTKTAGRQLNLIIQYQGCSQAGFCYTPIKKSLKLDLTQVGAPADISYAISTLDARMVAMSSHAGIAHYFDHNIFIVLLSFLALGVLLAFTPCVLPMVPILSGIIVGHGHKARGKQAFLLSIAYVLGMALTYAIIGMVVALLGRNVQAALQTPWVIVLFSALFILLALSLFGLYELQLPARWRHFIHQLSNRQQGGRLAGVFLMGCLSTLIVSPCVSAPLVGVLAWIGQTGDVAVGALALFALGLGMGLPLILIGMSASWLLPRAGHWMVVIERLFGMAMLGVAIYLLSRMLAGSVTLFLWGMLAIAVAVYLGFYVKLQQPARFVVRAIAIFVLIYGLMLMGGALLGNDDPLAPFIKNQWSDNKEVSFFTPIHSMTEFNRALREARFADKPVLLDFYADWCTPCVLMDRHVFTDKRVRAALANFVRLRVDLTHMTADNQAIIDHFHSVGPPVILIFGCQADQPVAQIVGETSVAALLLQITRGKQSCLSNDSSTLARLSLLQTKRAPSVCLKRS